MISPSRVTRRLSTKKSSHEKPEVIIEKIEKIESEIQRGLKRSESTFEIIFLSPLILKQLSLYPITTPESCTYFRNPVLL